MQPAIVRSGGLTLIAGAGALAVVIVVATRLIWNAEGALGWALRLDVLLLAASVGSVLDDPTESMAVSSPTACLARRAFRVVPAVAIGGIAWGLSVAASDGIGVSALTLMLAGLSIAGVAVGALTSLWAPQRAGVACSGFVLVAVLVIMRLPERWTMLPDSSARLHSSATLHWAAIIAVGFVTFLAASRDPCRSREARLRGQPVNTRKTQGWS